MRALVFAAIKANKLIGEKVWWSIEKFGSGFMSTLPIFDTPWGKAGIGTIGSGVKDIVWDGNTPGAYIQNKLDRDRDVVTKFIDDKFPQPGAENRLNAEKINSIIAAKPKDKATAEEALTAAWVTDFTAAVTGSGTAIYNEIMKAPEEDRAQIWKAIWEAAWDTTWRDKMVKTDATTKFTNLFKDKKVQPDTKETIEPILNETAESKTIVEALLNTGTTKTYEYVINNKTFTISKDGSGKYVATEKPAATK